MSRQAHSVLTARDLGARLAPQAPVALQPASELNLPLVTIDPAHSFQTIEGFGGAFTESAAVTLAKLPAAVQEECLRAYFDPVHGHGYRLCRVHMNSCDFSTGNYACSEVPGDFALAHFNINRDRQALLPMIQRAQALAGQPFKLFFSPWSPPAWMKTTGQMNRGGKLKPECRAVWAEHYCRFAQAYAEAGVPMWGLTVQNEPEATQSWDSCIYTGAEERDFVRDHLGPALERAGLGHLKLMIWDHNRDVLYERAKAVYDDPAAARYVWGAAFHWYVGDFFDNVQRTHEAWPDKHLLFSEGCQEGGPHLNEWQPAERYARSVIHDLNRWTTGWVDWNLLLDETGGPNHVGNLCSAPLLADTQRGELLYQPSYYYLGHFSRFIQVGARRIVSATMKDELEVLAVQNPDGALATVVLNRSETPIRFALKHDALAVPLRSPARSIMTICLPAP